MGQSPDLVWMRLSTSPSVHIGQDLEGSRFVRHGLDLGASTGLAAHGGGRREGGGFAGHDEPGVMKFLRRRAEIGPV